MSDSETFVGALEACSASGTVTREPYTWRYHTPAGYYVGAPEHGGWAIHKGIHGSGPLLGWYATLTEADQAITADVYERVPSCRYCRHTPRHA